MVIPELATVGSHSHPKWLHWAGGGNSSSEKESWLRGITTRPRAKEGRLCPSCSPSGRGQGDKHPDFSLLPISTHTLFPTTAGLTRTPEIGSPQDAPKEGSVLEHITEQRGRGVDMRGKQSKQHK